MKLSACVITKNEEKNLAACLDSVKSIASEIIVVDTGSTDRTVEIARSYGAKVFFFEWIDDFSAARNYAIEQAKSDWIIFLDADEYFATDCVPYIPVAIKEADKKKADMILCMMSNVEKKTGKLIASNLHIRIFRNHPQIRYVGAIHERIVRRDKSPKVLDLQKMITIIHTGYSEETVKSKEKSRRNLDLLLKELQKKPTSSDILFYISESYLMNRDFEKALEFAKKANQYRNSELKGIYEKNCSNILHCLLHLSFPKEEILKTITEAIRDFPDYPDFHLFLGDYYKQENRHWDAIFAYQHGLSLIEKSSVVQTNAIATASQVLGSLGYLYGKVRVWDRSVQYHVQAIHIDKYYYPSLYNLMLVLSRFEKPDAIFSFLSKFYDTSSTKDSLYLLKASLDCNIPTIAAYLFEKFVGEEDSIGHFKTIYHFLTEDYPAAFDMFLQMYHQTNKDEYVYGATAAVWIGNQQNHVLKLENVLVDRPELKQFFVDIVWGKSPIIIDKKRMYDFLIYVSGTLKVTNYHLLADLVNRSGLVLEMADYLFSQEKHKDAYLFYIQYLEHGQNVPSHTLADVHYKVGECCVQQGRDDQAWVFLQKAHSLQPNDFRIYESLLDIAKRNNRMRELKEVYDTALGMFPDSIYLLSLSEEWSKRVK